MLKALLIAAAVTAVWWFLLTVANVHWVVAAVLTTALFAVGVRVMRR